MSTLFRSNHDEIQIHGYLTITKIHSINLPATVMRKKAVVQFHVEGKKAMWPPPDGLDDVHIISRDLKWGKSSHKRNSNSNKHRIPDVDLVGLSLYSGVIPPSSRETSELRDGEDLWQHHQRIPGPLGEKQNRADIWMYITNAHRCWAWSAEEKHGIITTKMTMDGAMCLLSWRDYMPWAFMDFC